MPPPVGILAFGSLIDDPGKEIEAALVGRKANVVTPFNVEFARTSKKRGSKAAREHDPWVALGPPTDYETEKPRMHLSEQ